MYINIKEWEQHHYTEEAMEHGGRVPHNKKLIYNNKPHTPEHHIQMPIEIRVMIKKTMNMP